MPRRKSIEQTPTDPIAYAALQQEKEERTAGLFQPILPKSHRPEMHWIIPNLIPRGYLVILAADPKEGKTCLATALALAVATGTPFAGLPTNQSAVLWLSMEEGPQERDLVMDLSPLADPATPFYTCFEHLPIDSQDGLEALESWIDRTEARLIVVDPLHGAQSGRSLNDGWRARKTLKSLKRLCTLRGVTALVLHHAKLDPRTQRHNKVAENAQLAATASMDIVLTHRPLSAVQFNPQSAIQSPQSNVLTHRPLESPLPLWGRSVRNEPGGGSLPSLVPSEVRNEGGAGGGRSGEPGGSALRSLVPSEVRNEGGAGGGRSANPRLLTLRCRGRGPFANRTIYLMSSGPVDYQTIDDPDEWVRPLDTPDPAGWVEAAVLRLLAVKPQTSQTLMEKGRMNAGSLRNALTNLRRRGEVVVVNQSYPRRYALAEKQKNAA